VKLGRPALRSVRNSQKQSRGTGSAGRPKGATGSTEAGRQALAHRIVATAASSQTDVKRRDSADASYTLVDDSKAGVAVATLPRAVGDREYSRALLGVKPIKARLVQQFTTSSVSASTALTTVYPIDITLASDISSWINLFDEMRMDNFEFIFFVYMQWSGSVTTPLTPVTCAFDPTDATAVTGHVANIKAARCFGPALPILSNGVSGTAGVLMGGPLQTVPRGHYSLGSGPLMRTVLPGSSGGVLAPNPVQGAWVPATTASAIGGYYKFYGSNPGASLAWATQAWCIMHCEFRMRG